MLLIVLWTEKHFEHMSRYIRVFQRTRFGRIQFYDLSQTSAGR